MLIAARSAMMVSGGWKNPYVTDGLVAMWDGEWNAGPGMHDASATRWVDLSGNGKDFVWGSGTTGYQWNANHIALDNTNKTLYELAHVDDVTGLYGDDKPRTVETVVAFNLVYFDNMWQLQAPIILNGAAYPCGRWNGQIVPNINIDATGLLRASSRSEIQCDNWTIVSASVAQRPVYPCTIHANGRTATASQDYTEKSTGVYDRALLQRCPRADARIYCSRIYSRALTAEEIAANYAVDKARFDLP